MMAEDARAGSLVAFCCATVGTTACGAIDPVAAIADVGEAHGAWLHVDAAWAGTAALCEEFRPQVVAGADRADSWNFNPHKWMGVHFDCSCLWLADRAPMIESMSVTPEYLRNDPTESGLVVDFRDWHVQLGRRFRSLKLWLLLRCTGAAALGDMVRHHVQLACWLEMQVHASDVLELVVDRSLGLLCIGHVRGDDATQRVLDAINADGRFSVTHCRLGERLVIRVAIGTLCVEAEHVESLWEAMSAHASA
jgi:aromatic-L-amino-acid decarboxylase